MTTMQFTKATKDQAYLRLALIGPSGSGKTYSGLAIATSLAGPDARVALIDTEHGTASKYADLFDFDTLQLDSFEPATYVDAIKAAEAAGYTVLVIDSLSHAWIGKGGALEQVDRAAKRAQGNSFAAWRDVTPQHNALVDAILGARLHLIATLRAKTEYVQEKDDRGKTIVRKVGLAPVQRDGLEYEFDVVGDMDLDNNLVVSKTRLPSLAGAVVPKPGADLAGLLSTWLVSGRPLSEKGGHDDTAGTGDGAVTSLGRAGGGANGAATPLAADEVRAELDECIKNEMDAEMREFLARGWKDHVGPSLKAVERFGQAEVEKAWAWIAECRKGVWDKRRRHAFAVMAEAGLDNTDETARHAFVAAATGNDTGSTAQLSEAQLAELVAACEAHKRDQAELLGQEAS